jgi:uncharacterized DUF497 family protein
VEFEWDAEKAASNLERHAVSFEDASTVFGDPLALTILDTDHSIDEERELTIGLSTSGQTVVVWHTSRGEKTRIIGARRATPGERRRYESGE